MKRKNLYWANVNNRNRTVKVSDLISYSSHLKYYQYTVTDSKIRKNYTEHHSKSDSKNVCREQSLFAISGKFNHLSLANMQVEVEKVSYVFQNI